MIYKSLSDLKSLIISELNHRIGSRCALFDLPYYKNIGDVLIWKGELSFLQKASKELIYSCSEKTCMYPNLDKDVSILFQGGGNLGDLYINHPKFLLSLLKCYPSNPFLIFPQTVYFRDKATEQNILSSLETHRNIHLCCRDYKSFEIASKYLGDRCILIPDMAFCIDTNTLPISNIAGHYDSLFIKRNDAEKAEVIQNKIFDQISDWPAFEGKYTRGIVTNTIFDRLTPLFGLTFIKKFWDKFAYDYFLEDMIRLGINFISPYTNIYSERLHGAILSILLEKKVTVLDNNYGKNSTFYETWLKDFPNVSLLTS